MYTSTPRWNTARFVSTCDTKNCQNTIRPGTKYFYYPTERKSLCRDCGLQAQREIEADNFDERGY